MSAEQTRVFVERRTYRRRRIVDGARLLPVLGIALMVMPLLWKGGEDAPASTTNTMLYLFGLWVALVVVAGLLARHLKENPADPADEAGTGEA